MPTLLHLDSAAAPEGQSISRTVTADFRAAWLELNPGGTVIYRDLAADPVPHLNFDGFTASATAPEDRSEAQKAAFSIRETLIDELERADAVVIGSPMYNFAVPAPLKAWLDNVIDVGRTAHTDTTKTLRTPVTVVTSRGGSYAPGTPMESHEHLIAHLESLLGFMMRMDPSFIVVDLTLAKTIPGMEHLIPIGDQSFAQARLDAAQNARDASARLVG
nr:NAD(P)H-dependent oxidoreductase [Rhodococcus sp. (in: high G+C Gram-positive bacteria)]